MSWTRARAAVIARRDVEPLGRSRRGFDERLVLAAPWLLRLALYLSARARPGSLVRRALIGHAVSVGLAQVNRGDYDGFLEHLSPEVRLELLPDAPDARPADAEPIYCGRDGYLQVAEFWNADFADIRFELREFIDPGGGRIGARVDRVGRGVRSGVEVRDTDFSIWQFERGQLRRQWIFHSEAAMLELLEGTQNLRSEDAAADRST
jgi:ketosteroid isomerase-like protein